MVVAEPFFITGNTLASLPTAPLVVIIKNTDTTVVIDPVTHYYLLLKSITHHQFHLGLKALILFDLDYCPYPLHTAMARHTLKKEPQR